MSEENTQPTEKEILQNRARLMGISFGNATGVEKLKELIGAKMAGEQTEQETITEAKAAKTNALESPEEKNALTPREKLMAENLKLIRLRITNMDPKKKDLPGEVLTVGNEILGTIRKFVPYGEHTDNGYHVPYILYLFMKDRKFLHINSVTDRLTKQITVHKKWVREFSLEILDPLTEEELERLKTAQLASGSIVDSDDED